MHATYVPRTKWSYYEDVESLDQLILNLNERGLRESMLRTTLLHEKDRVVERLQKCSIHHLDNTKPEVKLESEIRKSSRQIRKEKEYDINLYFPSGTPVEHIMERTLVDMILETEEKIFVGGLGALKVTRSSLSLIYMCTCKRSFLFQVKDRSSWRNNIEIGKYNSQVETLNWGGKLQTKCPSKSALGDDVDEDKEKEKEKEKEKDECSSNR